MYSQYEINQHIDRHKRLEKLLEKVNYALLGEETDMRYEFERIKKQTIKSMKEEWDIITEMKLANQEVNV